MSPDYKPGDIVAFSGREYQSLVINLCTYGVPLFSASHVGIIGEHRGELLLFEATTLSPIPCVIQGKIFDGTQACRLEDRLEVYNGRAWLYPLYRRLFTYEAQRLNRFLAAHTGIPYDADGAIKAGGGLWSWIASLLYGEDLDYFFCSELCAAAFREIGLIRTDNASSWNPNRFVRHCRRKRILAKPRRLK